MGATEQPDQTDQAKQTEQFEEQREHLFAIAYRMLGSVGDAEDILQEAYLRYRGTTPASIVSPKAFLTTVVTRLCLNQLQSARAQRETYIGPWLPEPLLTEEEEDPLAEAERHESISMAFLVLLERLTPDERAVFLLREVFDYPYTEIAQILGKHEAACRQVFSRAKKLLVAERPRFVASAKQHHAILQGFLQAVGTGDLESLIALLSDDATLYADGGGKVRGAATRPLHGAQAVARFVLGSLRFLEGPYATDLATINGEPAIILRVAGAQVVVIGFTIVQGTVREIRVIGNPDKLRHIPPA
jgi:RNA polymerase sigma-70 factor, ECF subfamily